MFQQGILEEHTPSKCLKYGTEQFQFPLQTF